MAKGKGKGKNKEVVEVKLHRLFPATLDLVIRKVRIDRDCAKTEALLHLMELGLANADLPIGEFPGDDVESSSLVLTPEQFDSSKKYRLRYALASKTDFFLDVIARGATAWIGQNAPDDSAGDAPTSVPQETSDDTSVGTPPAKPN